MMIFPLNTLQVILSTVLYIGLFVQVYMLIKFIKKHTLLHEGVVNKLKVLSGIFIVLLVVKLIFNIAAIKGMDLALPGHPSDAYSTGYYAGAYTGHFIKTLCIILFQNIDLIFAIAFIWLLIVVFKETIILKKEQDLTI